MEKPEDVDGDVVTVLWFPRGRLKTQVIILGQAPPNDVKIAVMPGMSDDQARHLHQWMTYTPESG